jgi:alcohol dehydrogenase
MTAVGLGGRVILLGLEEESSELDLSDVIRREVQLVGSFGYTAAEFHLAASLLAELVDELAPLIEVEPLERGPEVFAALADRRDPRLKVALVP